MNERLGGCLDKRSVFDQFLFLFKRGLGNHIEEVNKLLPSLARQVCPSGEIVVEYKHGYKITTTLLHILAQYPKINYEALFQQDSVWKINCNVLNECSWTPLEFACHFKNEKAVQLLLQYDNRGGRMYLNTPLLYRLIETPVRGTKVHILKLLSEHGIDVLGSLPIFLGMGQTSYPDEREELFFLRLLLNAGADANCVNFGGQNPLHLVCKNHLMIFVPVLLASGCKYNQQDSHGKLPIDLITDDRIKKQFEELINLLELR